MTDATDSGTRMVKDINPGMKGSSPNQFIVLDDRLYFIATDTSGNQLWTSDGTDTGTKKIQPINCTSKLGLYGNICAFNHSLFFPATYYIDSPALWSYTPATGTGIEDINSRRDFITLYPNPCIVNNLTINIANTDIKTLSLEMISMEGKQIFKDHQSIINSSVEINIPGNIPNGVYILRCTNEKRTSTKKIILQR